MSEMQTPEPTDLKDILNQPSPEEQKPTDNSVEHPPQAEAQSDKDHNMAKLREGKLRAEGERNEYQKKLADLEAKVAKAAEPADDDYVEWRQVKGRLNDIQKQLEEQNTEQKLRSQFPDIDRVINPSNISLLNEHEPELARTIGSNPNKYEQAVAAYKAIKQFGIYKPETHVAEKKNINDNSSKPRPSAYVTPQEGDSPLHQANAFANGLTDDLKAQLWKEMQESTNNKI